MKYNKKQTVALINKKLSGQSFMSYKDIADTTGYHPKYILKLKREILNNEINIEHGNKNKKPINKMSIEEEEKIISLYKRSNTTIRKFVKFYGTRSYSCVYNILKKHNLIK